MNNIPNPIIVDADVAADTLLVDADVAANALSVEAQTTAEMRPMPHITIGTVETLATGEDATATMTGTYVAPVLNLGLPRGEQGIQGIQGERGIQGIQGEPGRDGAAGQDGYSPSARVTKSGTTATITIADKEGATSASIFDGQNGRDGEDGAPGFSPTASVSKSGNAATITITDEDGTTTATITDGTNGENGQDGFSPVATVTKVDDTATISITDKNGTTTASISDGYQIPADGIPASDLEDKYAAADVANGSANFANGIHYGAVDATSTSTKFTATIPGITSYYHGLIIFLKNGVVTSASGFTININGLGAKPSYSNMSAATADTTLFNINYTMLFIYDENRIDGGCWVCYRGYDANTNTIGYQLRSNSSTLPMKQVTYRYRILFTSFDGQGWVPSTTSTSTNATAKRDVNQAVIDPFGEIVYYGTTASVAAGSSPSAANLWQQYTLTLGYAFNRTGAALVLPYPKPIYIKAAPQTGGGAIIDADDPYVFALPNTEDGKIYIYLGRTYSATAIEIMMNHPVYYYKNGAIRLWTGPV